MPATIGAGITWALGASSLGAASLGIGTLTVNTIVGSAFLVGAEIGLQSALAPSVKAQQQQIVTRQSVPARRNWYGRNKASGPLAFQQSKNGNLYQVILLANHQIRFVEHWIGDRQVTLDGDGKVTAPDSMHRGGETVFQVITHDGADDQAADALLMSVFPDLWTANHRLRGIAYVVLVQYGVRAKEFTSFYPGGPQNYRAVFDGKRICDLTSETQRWDLPDGDGDAFEPWDFGNDNGANVLWDFHLSADGMRLPSAAMVPALADWKNEANEAAQLVDLKAGGQTARWRLAGGYDLTDAPKTTLGKMLLAVDGDVFTRGDGAVSCRLGRWEDPTVTIDDAALIGFSLPKGAGPLRVANQIRATFIDPNNDYQSIEAQPWRDEDDISFRGLKDADPLDLSWCQIHNQARRVMKIWSYRKNPERAGPITTNLVGLKLFTERRLRLKTTRRPIDMTCEITDSFGLDLTTMQISTKVSAITSAAYAFNAATEEGSVPAPDSLAQDGGIEVPQNVVAAGSGSTIAVSCDAPLDRTDLQFHAEYSPDDTVWTTIAIADGAYSGTTPTIAYGTYSVRTWFSAPAGASSEYVTVDGVVVGTESPDPPTGTITPVSE